MQFGAKLEQFYFSPKSKGEITRSKQRPTQYKQFPIRHLVGNCKAYPALAGESLSPTLSTKAEVRLNLTNCE